MNVGSRKVGRNEPCFVVAEAGLAHGGSREAAFELVDTAVRGRADAVKFQIYRAKELIDHVRAPEWYGRFRKKELPYDVFGELKVYAESKGLVWFATPHTLSAVEYLRWLGVGLYKVGSGEKGSDAVLGAVLDTGKPIIISLGMRTHFDAYRMVRDFGNDRVAFLHCITMYPVPPHYANLGFLRTLDRWCDTRGSIMGYSDHLDGMLGCEVAVAGGAKIIEKHIKLEDSEGQDTLCSLTGKEFRVMVHKIRQIESLFGERRRVYTAEERESEAWALKGKDGKRPL